MDWISVEDRLPEDRQEILYYTDALKKLKVNTMCYVEYIFKTMKATHWMPLPEPPKKDNEHNHD